MYLSFPDFSHIRVPKRMVRDGIKTIPDPDNPRWVWIEPTDAGDYMREQVAEDVRKAIDGTT
jgi:hypothetical protein